VVRGYGCTVSLGGPAPILNRVEHDLPPTLRVGAAGYPVDHSLTLKHDTATSRWQVVGAETNRTVAAIDDVAARCLLGELELFIAAHARRNVFIHAAAVAVNGRGIVLPGRTHSGKTTLAAELVRAGALYYSDEYAVLDAHGLLRPYPRPLMMRATGSAAAGPVTVESLGGTTGRRAVPVGLVAFLRHRSDATFAVSSVSPAHGVLGLIGNAVAAQTRPRAVLTAATAAMSAATATEGTRGDAAVAAAAILATVTW
jgi:hypothetical protein